MRLNIQAKYENVGKKRKETLIMKDNIKTFNEDQRKVLREQKRQTAMKMIRLIASIRSYLKAWKTLKIKFIGFHFFLLLFFRSFVWTFVWWQKKYTPGVTEATNNHCLCELRREKRSYSVWIDSVLVYCSLISFTYKMSSLQLDYYASYTFFAYTLSS